MSLGWLTEGTNIPKKAKELEIAEDEGLKDLRAINLAHQMEGGNKSGTSRKPTSKPMNLDDKLMSVSNDGVDARNEKDEAEGAKAKHNRKSALEEKAAKYDKMLKGGTNDDEALVDFASKAAVNDESPAMSPSTSPSPEPGSGRKRSPRKSKLDKLLDIQNPRKRKSSLADTYGMDKLKDLDKSPKLDPRSARRKSRRVTMEASLEKKAPKDESDTERAARKAAEMEARVTKMREGKAAKIAAKKEKRDSHMKQMEDMQVKKRASVDKRRESRRASQLSVGSRGSVLSALGVSPKGRYPTRSSILVTDADGGAHFESVVASSSSIPPEKTESEAYLSPSPEASSPESSSPTPVDSSPTERGMSSSEAQSWEKDK